ncbi:MAG: hypothetical protein DMF77_02260 [Acidobacteria bacterium]|nr:MAG: hypothetical protein DMF77_02260 [Acidobacteriota bacterium]
MKRARRTAPRKKSDYDTFLRLAHELPGVEEGISYGTPAVRVGGRFLARLREDGDLAIRCSFEDRSLLMEEYPGAFYVTDHYANYPAVLVRLSKVRRDVLRTVVEKAWRRVAPKRLVASHDRPRKA